MRPRMPFRRIRLALRAAVHWATAPARLCLAALNHL